MASFVIDSARTTERLSAFLTELITSEPVDQYFQKYPTIERLSKNKKVQNGGRQIMEPVALSGDPNMDWATDYDVVNTAQSDKVKTVGYEFVNIFSSVVISLVEMREIAGSDHMIFDRVKFGKDTVQKSLAKLLNSSLYAAAQVANKIQCLPIAVLDSGALGGLTNAAWVSKKVTHGAAYAAGGYEAMLGLYNDLQEVQSEPTVIITSKDLYERIEAEYNQDIRYTTDAQGSLGRGASSIMFKRVPIMFDSDATASVIYFINEAGFRYQVDSEGDGKFDPFEKPDNQHAFVSKFFWRGNLVTLDRRGQGKIITITA